MVASAWEHGWIDPDAQSHSRLLQAAPDRGRSSRPIVHVVDSALASIPLSSAAPNNVDSQRQFFARRPNSALTANPPQLVGWWIFPLSCGERNLLRSQVREKKPCSLPPWPSRLAHQRPRKCRASNSCQTPGLRSVNKPELRTYSQCGAKGLELDVTLSCTVSGRCHQSRDRPR